MRVTCPLSVRPSVCLPICLSGSLCTRVLVRIFSFQILLWMRPMLMDCFGGINTFFCIVLHCGILYCFALCYIALHHIVPYRIVLLCIALYCIALYRIALHCIVLYYIALQIGIVSDCSSLPQPQQPQRRSDRRRPHGWWGVRKEAGRKQGRGRGRGRRRAVSCWQPCADCKCTRRVG